MMTGRAGSGIAAGAGLPGAPLPGNRSVRQAVRAIVGLLLTGLPAVAARGARMWPDRSPGQGIGLRPDSVRRDSGTMAE